MAVKNKIHAHEDPIIYVHTKADTVKSQDEFNNGDHICVCVECGTKFIGMGDSYFCIKCLNEYF